MRAEQLPFHHHASNDGSDRASDGQSESPSDRIETRMRTDRLLMTSCRDWPARIGSARAPSLRRLDQHGRRGAVCVQFFIEPLKECIGVPVNASANSRGGDNGAVCDPVIDGSLRDRKKFGGAVFGDGPVGGGHGYQAGA